MASKAAEDCEPCAAGVILGVIKYVCEQNNVEKCKEMYEAAVLGNVKIRDYLEHVRSQLRDPQAAKALEGADEALRDLIENKQKSIAQEPASSVQPT